MKSIKINDNWEFIDHAVKEKVCVTIPHTVKIERLDVYSNYKGKFSYTRDMTDVFKNACGDRVFVEFEGVMINCKVFYNDKLIMTHFGGYLPFYMDITDERSSSNILRVEVENFDDENTPPGKKTSGLDFLYYGGIYRDVNVYYKPNVYITNELESDAEQSGIKLVATKQKDMYNLTCDISVFNKSESSANRKVMVQVLKGDIIVARGESSFSIDVKRIKTVTVKVDCIDINEWSVQSPNMYTVRVCLGNYYEDIEYGFRLVCVNEKGFYLNGKLIDIFGVNRHHQYPYIGIACSSEAERREARMLKSTGINTLRLAHYPQSAAFLSECSRIGLLVIECVPGWQFRGGVTWQGRLIQCVKDMVRRDRNVASVIMYEVTPNETHWPTIKGDKFYRTLHLAAKNEMANCVTSGDTDGRLNAEKVGFDVPYSGRDKLNKFRKLYKNNEKKFLKREYGDWGFGGNKSTSRVDISSGDLAMMQQAFNFQWDRNHTYEMENILGDILWEGIDHNRGYFPETPISKSGIFNVFRRPKYSYYWVKSQSDPNGDYTLFPAISECEGTKTFKIYSNCTSISIVENGKEKSRISADDGEYHYFDRTAKTCIPDNYWSLGEDHISVSNKNCPLAVFANKYLFDGGDCQNLKYPPFTCRDMEFSGKAVKFIGYDKSGNKVASYTKFSYLAASDLEIEAVTRGVDLKSNNNDWVWVYVKAIDSNGCIDYKYDGEMTVKVSGGSVVYSDTVNAEAGVGSFMLRASLSDVIVTARSGKMNNTIELKAVK